MKSLQLSTVSSVVMVNVNRCIYIQVYIVYDLKQSTTFVTYEVITTE